MATPTSAKKGTGPAGGPDYFKEKEEHIRDHFDSALRMANGTHTQPPKQAAAVPPPQRNTAGKGTPGADFMSNEDIRAFSEHVRKQARNRAVERSMDAAQLQAVLRNIPDQYGNLAGARARARRVARHIKLIAAAEKVIAKQAAALFASFEREFDSELRKVGKARPQAPRRQPFNFG